MNPVIVGSIDQLLSALRARRDELEITNETIDAVAGLADRYTSKILAANFPSKGLGHVSLGLLLGALGLGVARVIITEDPEQVARVQARWVKWKRIPYPSPRVSLSAKAIECAKPLVLRDLSKLGTAARMVKLTGQHRSRIARHAAKCRWRKRRNSTAV
jgi:hypothetical protein